MVLGSRDEVCSLLDGAAGMYVGLRAVRGYIRGIAMRKEPSMYIRDESRFSCGDVLSNVSGYSKTSRKNAGGGGRKKMHSLASMVNHRSRCSSLLPPDTHTRSKIFSSSPHLGIPLNREFGSGISFCEGMWGKEASVSCSFLYPILCGVLPIIWGRGVL